METPELSERVELLNAELKLIHMQMRKEAHSRSTSAEWNSAYPIGTLVRYWPVMPKREGEAIDTTTRSEAWMLGHGKHVVLVKGIAGGVLLSHLELRSEETFP